MVYEEIERVVVAFFEDLGYSKESSESIKDEFDEWIEERGIHLIYK